MAERVEDSHETLEDFFKRLEKGTKADDLAFVFHPGPTLVDSRNWAIQRRWVERLVSLARGTTDWQAFGWGGQVPVEELPEYGGPRVVPSVVSSAALSEALRLHARIARFVDYSVTSYHDLVESMETAQGPLMAHLAQCRGVFEAVIPVLDGEEFGTGGGRGGGVGATRGSGDSGGSRGRRRQ